MYYNWGFLSYLLTSSGVHVLVPGEWRWWSCSCRVGGGRGIPEEGACCTCCLIVVGVVDCERGLVVVVDREGGWLLFFFMKGEWSFFSLNVKVRMLLALMSSWNFPASFEDQRWVKWGCCCCCYCCWSWRGQICSGWYGLERSSSGW